MEKKGFYVIDTESDNYIVGQIFREDSEIVEEMRILEIGETYWSDARRGYERFK